LGTILGAALLDITLILIKAIQRFREKSSEPVQQPEDWKRVNMAKLLIWVLFWGAMIIVIGNQVLGQPIFFLVTALCLSFLFMLINGISLGLTDWNPISSAFVMSVFVFVALHLQDPTVGLLSAAIVFIACSVGGDMQQDRSTGWRLGTNRVVQFRYQ